MPQKHENNEIRCKTNIIQYHFSPTYIVNEKQIPIDRCVLVVREYAESNFAAICRVLMENMNTIFFYVTSIMIGEVRVLEMAPAFFVNRNRDICNIQNA